MAARRADYRRIAGLIITGIAVLVLNVVWAAYFPTTLRINWAIVVGLVAGFFGRA